MRRHCSRMYSRFTGCDATCACRSQIAASTLCWNSAVGVSRPPGKFNALARKSRTLGVNIIENVSRRNLLKGIVATGGLVIAAQFLPRNALADGGSVNAAVANFSKGLSKLGMRDGVNVNVVHPGNTRTERSEELLAQRAEAQLPQDIVTEINTERIEASTAFSASGR